MAADEPAWFPRLGAVPGISYETPPDVDVTKLRHRGERPMVDRFEGLSPSLSWGTENYATSQSPVVAHVLVDERKATTSRLLRNLAEALELPGEPSDYHFAVQNVISVLRSRRREGPHIFAELERLCWLDIQLIQACPDAISYDRDGGTQFYGVTAFGELLDLYLHEGALADAARVLPIADRFGQAWGPTAEQVRTRLAALEAEDAPA